MVFPIPPSPDKEFESYAPEQLRDIEKEFQKENEKPQYLLLLDGFNEINTKQAEGAGPEQSVRELLRNEIEQLARSTKGLDLFRFISACKHA